MKKKFYTLTDGFYSATNFDIDGLMEIIKSAIEDTRDGEEYAPEIGIVYMTQEEFEALPEFNG